MLETADQWRREYVPAYQSAHAAYSEALATITQDVDARQPQVELLENLNRLRRLGTPLMESELLKFHELEQAFACPANTEHLAEALQSDPICAERASASATSRLQVTPSASDTLSSAVSACNSCAWPSALSPG